MAHRAKTNNVVLKDIPAGSAVVLRRDDEVLFSECVHETRSVELEAAPATLDVLAEGALYGLIRTAQGISEMPVAIDTVKASSLYDLLMVDPNVKQGSFEQSEVPFTLIWDELEETLNGAQPSRTQLGATFKKVVMLCSIIESSMNQFIERVPNTKTKWRCASCNTELEHLNNKISHLMGRKCDRVSSAAKKLRQETGIDTGLEKRDRRDRVGQMAHTIRKLRNALVHDIQVTPQVLETFRADYRKTELAAHNGATSPLAELDHACLQIYCFLRNGFSLLATLPATARAKQTAFREFRAVHVGEPRLVDLKVSYPVVER